MMKTIPKNISQRLSTHAKKALNIAIKISKKNSSQYIGSLHIAYGIIAGQGSIGASVLKNMGIKIKDIEDQINKLPKTNKWEQSFSKNFWNSLEIALAAASNFNCHYIGTEHLLAGIITIKNSDFQKTLQQKRIDSNDIKKHIKIILESSMYLPEVFRLFGAAGKEGDSKNKNRQEKSALNVFGRDLTKQASEGKLDLIVGREEEVKRLADILGRKNKNNPLLIGDPGVGKTAIVHRLAQKIIANDVPDFLIGKSIISLDLALLVAGTMFRGEFEARIKEVLDEASRNDDIILFIDEIHTIVGAGSASGSLDAANILKPSLTRGEIQCIGATTMEEYKKYIEKDAALERRFQAITVEEPSIKEAVEMISKIKHIYEQYHNVAIPDEAIIAAVEMSAKYMHTRKLPDKAIDLIDEVSAKTSNAQNSRKDFLFKLKQLEKSQQESEEKKEYSIKNGDFEQAIINRDKSEKISEQLKELKKAQNKIDLKRKKISIAPEDIAKLISENTGIPANEISSKESIDLTGLEKRLSKKIVGQDEAISVISKAIRRSRAGLADPKRPIGSFMFLGPAGVGKTELAKTIAEKVFKNPKSLIKIDMSEFTEQHTISRLIGAPAGYVGFGEGGQLTEKIKRNPYSVVLFDEIEKAHPNILNILLQITEDGCLTDSSGKTANFSTALIIITSNIGTSDFIEEARIGFLGDKTITKDENKILMEKYEKIKETTLKELKRQILPEILNRLNKVIVFKPLGIKEIEQIIKIDLNELFSRIKKQRNIIVSITKKARQRLAKLAFSPDEGARVARSIIQQHIEDPISEMIIAGEIKNGDKIKIDLNKKDIYVKKIKEHHASNTP